MKEDYLKLIRPYCIGVYIVSYEEGEPHYLMMKRSGSYLSGIWQTVWGKVEQGEKGWQSAHREVIEETGLKPDRFYSADTLETFYEPDLDVVVLAPIFVAFIDTPQEVVLRPEEHDDFRWEPYQDVMNQLEYSCQKDALKHVHENFVLQTPSETFRINTD